MLVSVALFYTICLKLHSMRYCIKMSDYIFRYSSQVSLRTATSQPHLNFAAQKGGCSRPNHGHTHLNSKVFRCCLNSNSLSSIQFFLNLIDHRPDCLDPRIIFVIRLNDKPWCIFCGSFSDHFIDRSFIVIPLFTVTPVLICDLPLFLRCILPLCKTCKLGIFVDLDPEFNDNGSPV